MAKLDIFIAIKPRLKRSERHFIIKTLTLPMSFSFNKLTLDVTTIILNSLNSILLQQAFQVALWQSK